MRVTLWPDGAAAYNPHHPPQAHPHPPPHLHPHHLLIRQDRRPGGADGAAGDLIIYDHCSSSNHGTSLIVIIIIAIDVTIDIIW